MPKFSVLHNLFQRERLIVFNWVCRGRQQNSESHFCWLFKNFLSFIRFLGSVAGVRSDVSDVLSPNLRNGHLEYAQKTKSRPSTEQKQLYKPEVYINTGCSNTNIWTALKCVLFRNKFLIHAYVSRSHYTVFHYMVLPTCWKELRRVDSTKAFITTYFEQPVQVLWFLSCYRMK
jgi:hypothetical protein